MRCLLLSALVLGGCATVTPKDAPVPISTANAEARDDTRHLKSGEYMSSAWVNDAFTGTHYRDLSENRLNFSVKQTVAGGGWDASVSRADNPSKPVSDVARDAIICFAYDLNLDATEGGKWWVGPKISVNWAAMTDTPSSGEWYENYVVEAANQTPSEFEDDLIAYFDTESLGESQMNGATYRHILVRYEQWWQYWSIRQDYRVNGQLALGPILDAWIGLPQDLNFDGVKANIETHGIVRGNGTVTASQLQNSQDSCAN